jgi:CRISPR-associated endonuclease/helicase Cas3
MSIGLTSFWAKTDKDGGSRWHPLALHLLDVAASADAILTREPESTRKRMGEILGLEWEDARAWILLLIACHDVGKACPSFQAKWPDRPTVAGLRFPRRVDKHVNHGFVGQLALTELLRGIGWPDGLAELGADAVGCHHGSRASEGDRDKAAGEMQVGRGERLEEVRSDWHQARAGLFDALREVFRPARVPLKQ